jgi:hypothetical protein
MWDMNEQVFHVGVHTLTLDIDNIYLLTILSHCGSQFSLSGGRGGGDPMDYYVAQHCSTGKEKHNGKVPINNVLHLPLRTILFTITCVARITTPHMAS